MKDEVWMARAIELAAKAGSENESPVGAIVVLNDEIVGCLARPCSLR